MGVPWLGRTCGACRCCLGGQENLCDRPSFTGYTLDGGYAEYMLADQRYCFPIPAAYGDAEAAPLLCAGLMIGYRSPVLAAPPGGWGSTGFGAAVHIVVQVARHQGRQMYAFTRAGDEEAQHFARQLGAVWAGDSTSLPPEELDAAILHAPVGALVPTALGRPSSSRPPSVTQSLPGPAFVHSAGAPPGAATHAPACVDPHPPAPG